MKLASPQYSSDRHLNLFHTYNRDSELIENNATRALVVFLSLLSKGIRHNFLQELLSRARALNIASTLELDFEHSRFALQAHIDPQVPISAKSRFLVALSTEPLLDSADSLLAPQGKGAGERNGNPPDSGSIPDAWIFDDSSTYCFLIEVKVGSYPLDMEQLSSHLEWFGVVSEKEVSILSLTWIDVLRTLRQFSVQGPSMSQSEAGLFGHISEFLGYFGYRLFEGISFASLEPPPSFQLGLAFGAGPHGKLPAIKTLSLPPALRFVFDK